MTPDDSAEDQGVSPAQPSPIGGQAPSAALVAMILALGVLVGYGMGWFSFKSPWNPSAGAPVLYDERLVTSVYEEASQAVVEINVATSRLSRTFAGSGFVVDDAGHIVTNHHVVDFDGDISVKLSDGRVLPATKLGTSPADDLAVLKVAAEDVAGIKPLRLADSDEVQPGQLAIAIGSPFRQFNAVTVGVVSGVGRSRGSVLNRPIPNLVQTDAALNPGNSGGPLLDAHGEVIGVNSSVQLAGGVQIGVGFAISSNTLKGVLPDLMTPGEFKRPWIGVSSPGELTPGDFAALGASVKGGVYVYQVCSGSPGDMARLRGDLHESCDITDAERATLGLGPRPNPTGRADIITAVDGIQVASVAEMVSYFNTLRPGDTVTLTVLRDDKTQEVDVTLAAWGGM